MLAENPDMNQRNFSGEVWINLRIERLTTLMTHLRKLARDDSNQRVVLPSSKQWVVHADEKAAQKHEKAAQKHCPPKKLLMALLVCISGFFPSSFCQLRAGRGSFYVVCFYLILFKVPT